MPGPPLSARGLLKKQGENSEKGFVDRQILKVPTFKRNGEKKNKNRLKSKNKVLYSHKLSIHMDEPWQQVG